MLVGVIGYFALPAWMRYDVATNIVVLIHALHSNAVVHSIGKAAFWDAFYGMLFILLFWVLGHIPIATPLIVFFLFLRALSLGLAITGMIYAFGLQGAGFDLLGVLPWNILSGGAVVLSASVATQFTRQQLFSRAPAMRRYLAYCALHSMSISILFLSGWLQVQVMERALSVFSLS